MFLINYTNGKHVHYEVPSLVQIHHFVVQRFCFGRPDIEVRNSQLAVRLRPSAADQLDHRRIVQVGAPVGQ